MSQLGFEHDEAESKVTSRSHRAPNLLNDLDTREWLKTTKSVWYHGVDDLEIPYLLPICDAIRAQFGDEKAQEILGQLLDSVMVSRPPPRDALKSQHPATFSESDIEKLILFFTKQGDRVLDPFLGTGSSLKACLSTGRTGVGIELVPYWAEIARKRLLSQPSLFGQISDVEVIEGDARDALLTFKDESFGFIVTSPPYWSMLNKIDHKAQRERSSKGLATRYSDHESDFSNIPDYQTFLDALRVVFAECERVLQINRYIAVVVSDFRDKAKFHLFHADMADVLDDVGLQLAGVTILVQDSKALYPYGMPHAFVSNIHHQYVVIAKKPRSGPSSSERGEHEIS